MESKLVLQEFDHYAIEVKDLDVSVFFYTNVLKLDTIKRPNFDFEGVWLQILDVQIHLIENKTMNYNLPSHSRSLHFAFRVENLFEWKNYLVGQEIEIVKDIKVRPDGQLQLFIKDPDGYIIELTQM